MAIAVSLATTDKPEWLASPVLTTNTGFQVFVQANDLRAVQAAGFAVRAQTQEPLHLQGEWPQEAQWAFYQGAATAKLPNAVQFTDAENKELLARAKAVTWLRQVTNGTPEDISPVALADAAVTYLTSCSPHVSVRNRWQGEALVQAGWQGVWQVGRGSTRPPVLIEIDYNPTGDDDAPVATALVGKGITFDSGGYSIKPSEGMLKMKSDMGGAATVTAALGAAIGAGLQKRVRLILCCAENLISGHAYKLGDIITYKNGVTAEIVNTDAEGRLVLADGLLLASEAQPGLIIDAATLTGAATVALGHDYCAVMSLDESLWQQAVKVGRSAHDEVWPLPLADFHLDYTPSAFADTANSRPVKGGGGGGASVAAGFLSRFVAPDQAWLHFDLAGAYQPTNGLYSEGATGKGVRTISALI
ncbi:aminopeptidase PepB [Salinibius halmophilus]|uniref:aminopeptidase PepB n=1 Tax=Salinibius halmophilus TaxID=1853216 RepID=UPI000E661716|nr:aminopeptidase PepB [Salinibius halmophilus]